MGTLRRNTVTEMFSTFLRLEAGRFGDWIPDAKLRRNMQACLERYPGELHSEEFWVKYWHRLWKEQTPEPADLARMHLFAYLQEPMYWAAAQMLKKITSTQRHLEDYFQDSTHYLQTVLKKFDPKWGELKGFAGTVLLNSLRADVRRRGEASLCTVWALLRKVAKKRLVEAVGQEGFSKLLIDQYVLAWKCFKEAYVPVQLGGTRRLVELTPEQWEEIANLYNQERLNLVPPPPACTAIAIKQWLIRLEGIVRAYLYPTTRSLAVPTDGDSSSEIDIPDRQGSPIDAWLEIEDGWSRQEQQTQAYQVLMTTLDSLDPEWKLVLKLYYCENLTLQKIAANLEKPYAWVQRRVARSQKRLLEALVEWGQTVESRGEVNIPLDSDQVKHKGAVLEEWLEIRSRELCSRLL
jgi:RNA polymerase sigma factor (sigma-70 family)